jgi:ThiF family
MAVAASDRVSVDGGGTGAPPNEVFYDQFTARNRGLVEAAEQQRLRHTRFLVAGCGSIGGAVVEPLVRLGAEHLVRTDSVMSSLPLSKARPQSTSPPTCRAPAPMSWPWQPASPLPTR